jgi:hypothetical protein
MEALLDYSRNPLHKFGLTGVPFGSDTAGIGTEGDALVQLLADGTDLNAMWQELRNVLNTWNSERSGLGAVRFHDLRHSFATMNLSAGEHYMQVSKWLGHSNFVLTLSTYADYITEDELAAPKVGRGVVDTKTVVPLQRRLNA